MEDKGYEVNFQRVQVFIHPKGANPDTALRLESEMGTYIDFRAILFGR
jgi:hypothetical protein